MKCKSRTNKIRYICIVKMKTARTISALFFALLVLVSSTSFTVGMHFCMGEFQNIALFTKAAGCEKELELPACHRHTTAPCCEDETITLKGNDFKESIAKFKTVTPDLVEVATAVLVLSEVIPSAPLLLKDFYHYDPPLRSWDLTVAHQVFLI